jgi:hypothetical protein
VTRTLLASGSREVVIGFDQPFVIIGERINPTGRKLLAEEMKNGDYSRVETDALAQVEAGAQMLDVNAGIPLADEPTILAEVVRLVQSITDVPLSIDSSIVEALAAGLDAYEGKALVNSVTGEEERLEAVLPLVAKHGAAVVAPRRRGGRPPGHAGWRHADRRSAGLRPHLPNPGGATGQHDAGSVEHQLRPAQPDRDQLCIPDHGGGQWPHLGHHQSPGA